MVDSRRIPRHGIVWAADYDTPRFRALRLSSRVVYVTLTLYVDPTVRQCYPKRETLSAVTGLSTPVIDRALRELKEFGYIEIGKRTAGPFYVNEYQLLSPPRYPPPPKIP